MPHTPAPTLRIRPTKTRLNPLIREMYEIETATHTVGFAFDQKTATLFAAAPELLAALKAIVCPDNDRRIEFDSENEYYTAFIEGGELDRARAAIAKAIKQEE